MTLKKTVVTAIVLAMILAGVSIVAARGFRDGGFGMGTGFGPMGPFADIDLTDGQKAGIAGVLETYRDDVERLLDDLTAAMEKLSDATDTDALAETDVRQASRDVASVKEELNVLKANIIYEIKPLLTTEQVEKLRERRTEKQEKMKEFREKMRERIDEKINEWIGLKKEK